MRRSLAPMILALAAMPAAALAQPTPPEPTVITIRPAGEPTPALTYTLLPERRDLIPGNAAVFYHRAFHIFLETRSLLDKEHDQERGQPPWREDVVSDWIFGPLDQIPVAEARAQVDFYGNALHEIELGTLRRDCDWEFDLRPETIDLPIPEMNYVRSFARLISLKVRVAILDGDFDGAFQWLRVGYALARHVSQGPSVIQALVGVAIASMMNADLMELIQVAGTPNLYWAIAARPSPFIDLTPALEGERYLLERMLPEIRELDGPPWGVERARRFIDELVAKLSGFSGEPAVDRWISKLGLAAVIARAYPEARRSLIAEGRPEAEVEAMPAVQAVGLFSYRRYRELSDDLYKWMNLPYWQSYRGLDEQFSGLTPEEKHASPGVVLFTLLQPALHSVRVAQVRLDRQLAALQCVEAVRLHAASNDGRFPPSLGAIADAPPPIDPATGEPFGYAVDGDTATLTAPMIPGAHDSPLHQIRYELRLSE